MNSKPYDIYYGHRKNVPHHFIREIKSPYPITLGRKSTSIVFINCILCTTEQHGIYRHCLKNF